MQSVLKFLILVVIACGYVIQVSSYEYNNQAKWYDEFRKCRLTKQSPIELNQNESAIATDLPQIYFHNYDMFYSKPAQVENNGHTANIILPKPIDDVINYYGSTELWKLYDRLMPQIYGGPLCADRFIAESVHFHWGSKDAHGSEHVIDGGRHTMEMHILNRNGKYKTVEEARELPDGLAVIAILFQASRLNADYPGLNSILETLDAVDNFNSTSDIKSFFTLASLLGDIKRDEYFTYEGSLTTPPCSESVKWIVFPDVIPMSHTQMGKFHQMRDEHNQTLENNYRSLQAKGSRKVTFRKSIVRTTT